MDEIEPARDSSYKALRAIIARQNMTIRAQNDRLRRQGETLLKSAGALALHGLKELAAECMDAWKERD